MHFKIPFEDNKEIGFVFLICYHIFLRKSTDHFCLFNTSEPSGSPGGNAQPYIFTVGSARDIITSYYINKKKLLNQLSNQSMNVNFLLTRKLISSGTSLNLPSFCLHGFLLTRGPIPCPSFQPIFRNSSTPTVILRRKQKETNP